MALNRVLTSGICNRAACLRLVRYGSTVERPPLPPPSPVKNLGEYIEPKLMAREHTPPMYRERNEPSKLAKTLATIIGTFMWTWILLGFYYESDHITGHHPWPNAKEWTDKELGIPANLELEGEEAE